MPDTVRFRGRAAASGWVVIASLVLGPVIHPALLFAAPKNGPGILSVTPAVRDSSLVCGITTRGLPDAPSRETLESGLPSALVFAFSVLDASGKDVGGSRAEIRIEPDLWENVFFLRMPALDRRAASIADVEAMLARVNPIPIVPVTRLRSEAGYRVRVRLAVYPLAPSELRRSRGMFTGDSGMDDPDRRETSVGLNSLLKFFLGGDSDDEWIDEVTSTLFTRRDLPRLPVESEGAGKSAEGEEP